MAIKKLRFPLEMENGAEVRTIEELRENFSMEKVLLYYSDGRLLKWLRNNYLDEEAEAVSELDPKDLELNRKICGIFNVEYNESAKVSIEEVNVYKQKLTRLKEYTSEKQFDDVIERIAFDQNELEELLQQGVKEVYLCGDRFNIPLDREGIRYIGVNEPIVVIDSAESVDFNAKNISFQDIRYDEEYLGVVAEEKINADFSGSAWEWVEPPIKICKKCGCFDVIGKALYNRIFRKYTAEGYVHYLMLLIDYKFDKDFGANACQMVKFKGDYVEYKVRNLISIISDNLNYMKNYMDLSRNGIDSVKMNYERWYSYNDNSPTNLVKYSGLLLFQFKGDYENAVRFYYRSHIVGVLVPDDISAKIVSMGIPKSIVEMFSDSIDYSFDGFILPFDYIKNILLNERVILLHGNDHEQMDLYRDIKTKNFWLVPRYGKGIDESKFIDDD